MDGLSKFFENPMIQKYMLALGAGMMNQPTFGRSVGNGMQLASQVAIDDISNRQNEALIEKRRQQQLQDALSNQKALYEYKKQIDDEQTAKQRDQINSVIDALGLDGKQSNMMKLVAQYDPSAISSVLSGKLNGDKQWELKNDQVNGGFVKFNPSTGEIAPVATEVPTPYSNVTTPTASVNPGVARPRNLFDVSGMSPKTKQLYQEAQVKADVDNLAKQRSTAQEFVANDQNYDSNRQQIFDALDQMESHLKGDENFRKNDWLWGNLPDNSITNTIRSNVTEDKNNGLLKRDINAQVFDLIRQMAQAGGSSKIFDSNAEREALNSTILDPKTPYETKLEAIQSLRKKAELADQQYQTKRNYNYDMLGLELPKGNSKSKNNIISIPTNGKAIGSTGMMGGKRIRVVGANQIEVLD
ncbi:hypothetical protein [Methylobacter sp. sgz302048]|uniref:hypothetical protein n=1 Tax=Methylobacter sp. sgz302048 TaxID=3455945 RepID=UPI003F9F7A5C